MLNKEAANLRGKLKDFIAAVRQRFSDPAVDKRLVIDQMKRIKYDVAAHDHLLELGMAQDALGLINDGHKRKKNRDPLFPTKASSRDVSTLAAQGAEIEIGSDIHKDPLLCSKTQLKQMLRTDLSARTGRDKRISYLAACLSLRFQEQFALPIDIPVDIQLEQMNQAEKDLAVLQSRV